MTNIKEQSLRHLFNNNNNHILVPSKLDRLEMKPHKPKNRDKTRMKKKGENQGKQKRREKDNKILSQKKQKGLEFFFDKNAWLKGKGLIIETSHDQEYHINMMVKITQITIIYNHASNQHCLVTIRQKRIEGNQISAQYQ
jgi:nucleosome binding factor SPN SPT16 subunit